MAFSLSNWFKGKPDEENPADPAPNGEGAAPAASPPQSNRIPASVRTATPNTAPSQGRGPVSLRDPSSQRAPISLPTAKPPTTNRVQSPVRMVSTANGMPPESAPAPAPVFEPAFTPTAPDITISLEIGDFLDRLPPGFLKPGPANRSQKVEFQASELYSDLAKGRASVPASVIYRRCPGLFVRPVSDTEDVEVPLPLQKLVEQMGAALSTREDQYLEENVGEIETPFLQVAMEDNARLPAANGSAVGAVRPPVGLAAQSSARPVNSSPEDANGDAANGRAQRPGHISAISPVKMPPETPQATAPAGPIINGKRPPSTVRATVAGSKIRVSGQSRSPRIAAAPGQDGAVPPPEEEAPPSTHSQRVSLPVQPASPSHQVTKKTARIQIPPISLRTGGANAAPRPGAVPPPPTSPTAPPPTAVPAPAPAARPGSGHDAPMPVTFRTSPPPSVKPVPLSFPPPKSPIIPPPVFPAALSSASVAPVPAPAPAPAAMPATKDDRKIKLGLAAILRGLPSSMLAVDHTAIPDDVRLELPFALIEPQLSQGRVSIRRDVFTAALPEAHREVLAGDDASAEIAIPLQEVFQNLPADALTLRADQVKEETGMQYPTPFSQKAEEDAQRFSPSPEVPTAEASAPEPAVPETLAEVSPGVTPATAPVSDVQLPMDDEVKRNRDIPLEPDAVLPAVQPPGTSAADHETAFNQEVPESEESSPVDLAGEKPAVSPVENQPVPELPAAERLESVTVEDKPSDSPVHEEPTKTPEMLPPPEAVGTEAVPVSSLAPVSDGTLQTLFMTEEELDAKLVVKMVCQLPAVTGCAIMFEDGLRLAGNFPDGESQGFSAMSAPIFKRAARFVSELELGTLQTFTLHTGHDLLSFFMHDKICVGVRHTGRGFLPGVREKLEVVTRELARMYSNAEPGQTVP